MLRRPHTPTPLVILATACATLLGANLITSAGNLTPPDGAVTPTMSSLEEIESKLDLIVGSATVVPRYWEVVAFGGFGSSLPPQTWGTLVEVGNGTIEALIPSGDGISVVLRDGAGRVLYQGTASDNVPLTGYYRMNVRYENGFEIWYGGGSAVLNVLYTPDVPPGN